MILQTEEDCWAKQSMGAFDPGIHNRAFRIPEGPCHMARMAWRDADVYLPQPLVFIALSRLVYFTRKFAEVVAKPQGVKEETGSRSLILSLAQSSH